MLIQKLKYRQTNKNKPNKVFVVKCHYATEKSKLLTSPFFFKEKLLKIITSKKRPLQVTIYLNLNTKYLNRSLTSEHSFRLYNCSVGKTWSILWPGFDVLTEEWVCENNRLVVPFCWRGERIPFILENPLFRRCYLEDALLEAPVDWQLTHPLLTEF